jgi:hypothetical protein
MHVLSLINSIALVAYIDLVEHIPITFGELTK